MAELLKSFSIADIVTGIVTLSLAIKGVITFFDWAYDRLRQVFDKEYNKNAFEDSVNQRFSQTDERLNKLIKSQTTLTNQISTLNKSIEQLVDSDKDDIKAFITREHHYFVRMGWIDDYSLDCIEKRYAHYKQEGGNSFIKTLMEEIRRLPKVAPNTTNNINN